MIDSLVVRVSYEEFNCDMVWGFTVLQPSFDITAGLWSLNHLLPLNISSRHRSGKNWEGTEAGFDTKWQCMGRGRHAYI